MSSPLYDAISGYVERKTARFHMPGHKGVPIPPVGDAACWDITEVAGADSLFEAQGPIAETEARYSALYGTLGTLLSAGGSTLCIQTMLALAARPGSRIVCGRGCHTAAVNAMALLDLTPVWVYPDMDESTGLFAAVTAEQIAQALDAAPDAVAVYITSPNYFGIMCDIAAIAAVCHSHNIPLLVDNAHGAHLRFFQPDLHPATLGADLCCDSLHKTLPVLTGGALLHIQSERYLADAKHRMSLFGSTSPSYLILLSIDAALPYLEQDAPHELAITAERVDHQRYMAKKGGFALPRGELDPIRLSLGYQSAGLDAESFRALLDHHGVEPEYLSDSFCVFLAGAHNTVQDYVRLAKLIAACPSPGAVEKPAAGQMPHHRPVQTVPLRQALFAQREHIPLAEAGGRICAGVVVPCPPGIPVAMPGEMLDKYLCDSLKKYGVLFVNVLK